MDWKELEERLKNDVSICDIDHGDNVFCDIKVYKKEQLDKIKDILCSVFSKHFDDKTYYYEINGKTYYNGYKISMKKDSDTTMLIITRDWELMDQIIPVLKTIDLYDKCVVDFGLSD